MQISDTELKKVIATGSLRITEPVEEQEWTLPESDKALVAAVTQDVMAMPDREDRLEELRKKIASGTYRPTGEEIADAMMRRAIADRVR